MAVLLALPLPIGRAELVLLLAPIDDSIDIPVVGDKGILQGEEEGIVSSKLETWRNAAGEGGGKQSD